MIKPIVEYYFDKVNFIEKGMPALVQTKDHPSELVSNTKFVRTSEVILVDTDKKSFETLNTIYIGVNKEW